MAVSQTLTAITATTDDNRWRPSFSGGELIKLVKMIIGEVKQNPGWVKDELIGTVLKAIYASFSDFQADRPLPFATLEVLIESALAAVNQRKQLVIDIGLAGNTGDPDAAPVGKLVLSYGLEGLFIKLYRDEADSNAGWTLTQTEVLHTIIPYFLARLSAGSASKETVDSTLKLVQSSIDQLNDNLAWTVDSLIDELATFPTTA
jgi:hypothetical protein